MKKILLFSLLISTASIPALNAVNTPNQFQFNVTINKGALAAGIALSGAVFGAFMDYKARKTQRHYKNLKELALVATVFCLSFLAERPQSGNRRPQTANPRNNLLLPPQTNDNSNNLIVTAGSNSTIEFE